MDDEILKRAKFAQKKIDQLRRHLSASLDGDSCCVVAIGSYARREASAESDLDYYLIFESASSLQKFGAVKKIERIANRVVPKPHAADGAFGASESIRSVCLNIGGEKDGNQKTTRRILFLLEGDWLFNQEAFSAHRNRLLKRYIMPTISDHQMCKFLLNDLVRYYRTMCVDFEHKTVEVGKSWGTRNIKLLYSRKLLYFSGILVAAESWQQTYEAKLERVTNLLSLTPIERIRRICGAAAEPALIVYATFLKQMADSEIRKELEQVNINRKSHTQAFRQLKNDGHHFSWMLAKLLREVYDVSHPIHNALIF